MTSLFKKNYGLLHHNHNTAWLPGKCACSVVQLFERIPPKSKCQKQLLKCLEKGREVKRSRRDSSSQVEAAEEGEQPY